MNGNKLLAYGKGITNVGIHTGNGTTSHIEDFEKANRSNLIETYNVRQNKDDIVNIGLHFFLKNVRPYAASCSEA